MLRVADIIENKERVIKGLKIKQLNNADQMIDEVIRNRNLTIFFTKPIILQNKLVC